jgi:SOS-response transcriptional repressor LexA
LSHPAQDILDRFSPGGAASPEAAAARAALRSLLARIDKTIPTEKPAWEPHACAPTPDSIPVVGRTAAGILASWEEWFGGHEDPGMLERLIRQVEGKAGRRREADLKAADPQADADQPRDRSAMLTQLSAPTPEGVVEFLDVPGLGPPEPGSFALRVDGDSMAPRILDGDLVVSRRSAAPAAGRTAIVKVRDRIGVTVKLWRPEGDRVHLIPINEAYQQALHLRADVAWACRVLWVVRL